MNRLLSLILLGLLLASCGMGPDIAGGSGSESPNALTGTVLYQPDTARPASFATDASVTLYRINESLPASGSVEYQWQQAAQTMTDNNGNFTIPEVASGNYSLIMEYMGQKKFSGYFTYHAGNRPVSLGYLALRATQNIRGSIRDTAVASPSRMVLGLVGTPYSDTVETDGAFTFGSVPVGNYYFSIKSLPQAVPSDTLKVFNMSYLYSDATRPAEPVFVYWGATIVNPDGTSGTAPIVPVDAGTSVRSLDTVSTTVSTFKIQYTLENNTNP